MSVECSTSSINLRPEPSRRHVRPASFVFQIENLFARRGNVRLHELEFRSDRLSLGIYRGTARAIESSRRIEIVTQAIGTVLKSSGLQRQTIEPGLQVAHAIQPVRRVASHVFRLRWKIHRDRGRGGHGRRGVRADR